jgi:hypothetical protein
MVSRVIKKTPGGVEDLTFGFGEELQQRGGLVTPTPINRINSDVIPHKTGQDEITSTGAELRSLNTSANILFDLIQSSFTGALRTVKWSTIAVGGQTIVQAPYSGFTSAEVYVNGVRQDANFGAYAILGAILYSQFVFAEPLNAGDEVALIMGIGYEVTEYSNLETYAFIAESGDTDFDLGGAVPSADLLVWVNGVKQASGSYVLNGDMLEFPEALNEGDLVEAVRLNRIQAQTQYVEPVLMQKQVISSDLVITSDYNAFSVSPTIAEGVTVTVAAESTWLIM